MCDTAHQPTPEEIGDSYDPRWPLGSALDRLVTGLLAIRDAADDLVEERNAQCAQARDRWEDYARGTARAAVPAQRDGDRPPLHDAPPVKQPGFLQAMLGHQRSASLAARVPRMLLLEAVAQYDAFAGNVLRGAYKVKPEKLDNAHHQLDWADISHLADLDAARGLVVEHEVADLSHRARLEQLDFLAGRLNIGTLKEFDEVGQFIEITERRNLFAHTDGRVSAHYLGQCRKHGIRTEAAPGHRITADAAYVRHACETLLVVGAKLTQTIWRAIGDKHGLKSPDRHLSHLTYTLLAMDEHALAERLLRFAYKLKRHHSEAHRLVFTVNYAQAFKWQDNDASCAEVLAGQEWDSKAAPFQLAHAVLSDDFVGAAELLRDATHRGQISRAALDHWPLFRVFRTTTEYATAYRDLYAAEPPSVPVQLDLRDHLEIDFMGRLERSA